MSSPETDTNATEYPIILGMERRVQDLANQVLVLQQELGRLKSYTRPRLPWKFWIRHQIKVLLDLRVVLGKLSFTEPPKVVGVPKWYHTKPVLKNPPVISIATPSYNQGDFLEGTMRSVLDQEYPELQYVVQDGGSTDSTVDVLARYRSRLHHCEMQKDRGQSHAINLGLAHTDGAIMAYLNSDDILLPGALHAVAKYFEDHPDVDVVYGHRVLINQQGDEIGRWVLPPHDTDVLKWADYVPQETMFWRRRIWDKVGGIDESFRFAMDWDLIARFVDAGAKFYRMPRFLGAFRIHDASKTMTVVNTHGQEEMTRLRRRIHGRDVSPQEIQQGIRRYLGRHVIYNRLYRLGLFRY
ncbi:glycosyltransferase [Gemmata sp. G18]|uniref:Glycosyltransferase n=1 Tax=Gemmata palustris TaxID=2822762 RepID=A0ABS5BUP4_9BACT|nr:glycosyltransferase family 2 protein [Gemmata palustris]MBP3957442.1 glycosyltransferase [Gemmata palustris]